MEGKTMAKRKNTQEPAIPSKFKVGDKVRVKHGVRDVDYPDMPLGGWAGTIAEADKHGNYSVRWSKETLANIHPVIKQRCERDGLILEECGLAEHELEPDIGGPLNIAQPTKITTKPLSPKDEEDRVRMIFGLTSNDPLPDVDDETLLIYHKYLATNLTFPFEAEHGAEYGDPEKVKVIGLGDPDEEPMIDDEHGILGEARLEGQVVTLPLAEMEVLKGKPNRQLIEDYCSWFWDYR
jgi:hypothetical protein